MLLRFRDFKKRWFWWAATLATLIILGLALWLKSEQAFRVAGGIFQLLGVGTVAWGIHETRELFGKPGIFTVVLQGLRNVLLPKTIISGGASFSLSWDAADNPQVDVWRNAGPNDSLETRIVALEKNLSDVNNRLVQQQNDNINRFKKHA